MANGAIIDLAQMREVREQHRRADIEQIKYLRSVRATIFGSLLAGLAFYGAIFWLIFG